jgi:hypothetical protein
MKQMITSYDARAQQRFVQMKIDNEHAIADLEEMHTGMLCLF